jgi:hypothetical protein
VSTARGFISVFQQLLRLILVGAVLSVPATAQIPWQPPRTPDGQPDMQGIWENSTLFTVVAALSLEGDHSRWQADFGLLVDLNARL